MSKAKGGRGQKLPYEQTHIRVPLPIRDRVQRIIDSYRNFVFGNEIVEEGSSAEPSEVNAALKLLKRFIDDSAIDETSYERPTRDNKNLKRFEQWLFSQL